MDDAAGFDRKNAQVRSYYSGFRAVRRRYGELCMVSPAASRCAGFFPCMPCICRVIDGCVNFIGAQYRYEPGLSSSTRRLRYGRFARASRHERASHFPRSDKSPPMQFGFPFGGFKQSGLGRENGREGIEAFMQTKSVLMRM